MKNKEQITAILLAGGKGSRMKTDIPKQFISLKSKPIALYSFELFLSMKEFQEIVVVCEPEFRSLFEIHTLKKITFAEPGKRRQDSVYNGLKARQQASDFVCIHDSARPFITLPLVQRVLDGAREWGASAAGMPIKYTIKQHDGAQFVHSTPNRSLFWEIQTPQTVSTSLLEEGFKYIEEHQIEVTDDVSIVELLKKSVKLVTGCYRNIKITTPEDLAFALHFLDNPFHV